MQSYYQIREVKHPTQNGIVVLVNGNRLETFVGDSKPSKYSCKVDKKGNISVNPRYSVKNISSNKARGLRRDYFNWLGLQSYIKESYY